MPGPEAVPRSPAVAGADTEAQAAFDRILLRAERTRAGLVAAFFGTLTVALVLRVAIEAVRGAPEAMGLGVAIVVFLGGVTGLELLLRRDAATRLREDRPPSDLVAYAFTVVEIGAYTVGNMMLGIAGDAVIVVIVALVALSAFRLIPSATFLAGVTAAVAYLVLVWAVRSETASDPGVERFVWTAALIVASGGALDVMAGAVRRAALRLATEAVRRQQLQADLLESVEATQERTGRALHDGVGSHLTGLSFYTRGLVRRLERGEPVTAAEMEEAAAMVDDAVRQVRQLSRGLSPSEIEPGTLALALADLAASASRATGLPVTLNAADGLPALAPGVEAHLYRIVQEAVVNALKHADPSYVAISLEDDDGLALTIEDDGAGLPPPTERVDGVGLRSMRHRADLAGGHIDVGAGGEGGTIVRVVVPS
ncbi:MAG: ATP-binding protein [Rhodothermales bacterium]